MTAEKKQHLDSLFDAFSIIAEGKYVFLCDMSEDISRWSQSAVDFFDLTSEYMKNAGAIWSEHIHPDDRSSYDKSISEIFAGTNASHDIQYRALAKDGTYVSCTCRGVVIKDTNNNNVYFGGVIQNHGLLSYNDTITGLRSLYGFIDDLQSIFWNKVPCSILLVGLSRFSHVNDVYGYTFGNSVLRQIGNTLREQFAGKGSVYRMDGTKFAVISKVLSEEQMSAICKEIQKKFSHQFEVENETLSLSLNAGIVRVDNFDISTETVYCCLKYAYYQSKDRKLGHAVIFEDALTDDNRQLIGKLNTIRNSVAENCKGFFLCYQPIMDAKTEKIKGLEALIRWKNNSYGTVPPVQFIPVLEQDTLFPELGQWILRQAMNDGKLLLKNHPELILNVNLSYTQLEMSSFPAELMKLLDETGFPPKNLCLEITERCKILDKGLLKNVFRLFREHGIKIALDDFGTGFSSIGLLRDIPVDIVKIDREYVSKINTSKNDQQTVRLISDFAETFDAEVCVEGVESEDIRNSLIQCNVSSLQGYYYSKPVPIDQILDKYGS
ncbi:MAG: EAL domain-containing protein [Ruminococcus sp.]|nr:EAL domain-containing protein [Ruminococcus sp.]